MISVKFALNSQVRQHGEAVRKRLAAVPPATCEAVKERVEVAMAEPKSGHVYGTHQASAPGEAPAIDTRGLLESGHVEVVSERQSDLVYDDKAAVPMELGAPARGLAPRPFLGPAMEQEREPFFERVREALSDA